MHVVNLIKSNALKAFRREFRGRPCLLSPGDLEGDVFLELSAKEAPPPWPPELVHRVARRVAKRYRRGGWLAAHNADGDSSHGD